MNMKQLFILFCMWGTLSVQAQITGSGRLWEQLERRDYPQLYFLLDLDSLSATNQRGIEVNHVLLSSSEKKDTLFEM